MARCGMVATIAITAAAVGIGVCVGYRIATDTNIRNHIIQSMTGLFESSKKRVEDMSEDVAVRTAKATKNPKITQDWVAHQWESVGY